MNTTDYFTNINAMFLFCIFTCGLLLAVGWQLSRKSEKLKKEQDSHLKATKINSLLTKENKEIDDKLAQAEHKLRDAEKEIRELQAKLDHAEADGGMYSKFIHLAAGKNEQRFNSLRSVAGYLMHSYKTSANNKAIIMNDELISENPNGGSGKGMFCNAIGRMKRVATLDGKQFSFEKSFPYQTITAETNVLVFDDVKKNFDFESKFSLVTEGMTLERKNKDAIKLKVEDSPKIVISTNYAIKGEGNSHNRRRHEIEFAQYYGKDITPISEFNRALFDDWELNDFNKFDNYMVECLQKYLNNGLIEQNAKNIHLRKFIAETSMEFFDWINDRQNLTLNVRHDKIEVYNRFVEDYPDFKKWLQRKTFSVWIKKYSSYRSFEYTDGRTPNRWFSIGDGGQVVETKYDWLND